MYFRRFILVAEIGGYLGMTLGVSMMDLQLVSKNLLQPILAKKKLMF